MLNSKAKGANGEREILAILQQDVDFVCKELNMGVIPQMHRNLEQTRESGCDCAFLDFAIEVKRVEQLNIKKAWKQAVASALPLEAIPVLLWRKNYAAWEVRARLPILIKNTAVIYDVDLDLPSFRDYFRRHLRIKIPDIQSKYTGDKFW